MGNASEWQGDAEKKGRRLLWRLSLFLVVILAGAGFLCYKNPSLFGGGAQPTLSHPKVEDSRSTQQVQEDFEQFMEQIFEREVTSDSLTLNYTLADPQKAGVKEIEPSLGEYSLSSFRDSLLMSENWLAGLRAFPYDKLGEEQQLLYDILTVVLQTNLESTELLEYSDCISPVRGIQAQLPILMAEFNFYRAEDVETYIQILSLIPEYFAQIIAFEKEKSEKGLFMADTTAQAVIEQCQEFIADPENCYLITIFDDKIKEVSGLNKEEKADYKKQNKTAVMEAVIPAHQQLIEALEACKGTGKQGGLCKLEKGREYYEYQVRSITGSSRSMKEINQLLDRVLRREQKILTQVMTDSPDAYYDAEKPKYPCEDPVETLDYLQQQITSDFTALPDEGITCDVKYVAEALEDSCSPAFYLTPPIDRYQKNVIYLNQSKEYDLSQAFTTIAHESYPGHLYQNMYFQATDPSPLRSILSIGGYVEGWGTYAELYSYDLAGLKEDTAKLLKANTLATLCLYSKADIGVNYFGWSLKKLVNYLDSFGFSASQAQTIYDTVIADPVNYMQYTLGYLEIEQLKEKAQKKLGAKFTDQAFHDFFLGIGPAPFVVIEDRMQRWIEDSIKGERNF